MSKLELILDFWFNQMGSVRAWFMSGTSYDNKIKGIFEDCFELYQQGKLDHWEETPKSCLALVILLDQFSRHVYRGSPKAYSFDNDAVSIVMRNLTFIKNYCGWELVFFLCPLQHSEDISIQKYNLHLWKGILSEAFSSPKSIYQNVFKHVEAHYQIISKFGRFPKRNKILGRKNTPEEDEYLQSNPNGHI